MGRKSKVPKRGKCEVRGCNKRAERELIDHDFRTHNFCEELEAERGLK